jgi:L,D-transpeptidase ErfK/SrfK
MRQAVAAELPFHQGVGGVLASHTITAGDSLVELARRYDVGYNEITAANPGVDPFIPEVGTRVTIPGQWLLPDNAEPGEIVINLAEMRLYLLPLRPGYPVTTFPVGIGDDGVETPTGTFRVVEKIVRPVWHVPPSIRRQRPRMPKSVPPGPDNPLGSHALRLSNGSILIHGTNRPFGVGRQVSHGCIRLYPEDIAALFEKVPAGTRVTIVSQPIKSAEVDGRVLVEIHAEVDEELVGTAIDLFIMNGLDDRVDRRMLMGAAREKLGIPVDVTAKTRSSGRRGEDYGGLDGHP